MTKPKFTAGPWLHCYNEKTDEIEITSSALFGEYIASIDYDGLFDDEISCTFIRANAQLIAAAPDLYYALDGLLIALSTGKGIADAIDAAKAAMPRTTQGDAQ